MWSHDDLKSAARFQVERLRRMRHLAMARGSAEPLPAALLAPDLPPLELADLLTAHLWSNHLPRLDAAGTLAYYPGAPSIYGARNDAIEGVTRLAPLWAAYASWPGAEPVRAAAMASHLKRLLVAGCDPEGPGYWGDIDDYSTLICEAADVALAVWLGRDSFWRDLGAADRRQVMAWLGQAIGRRTVDNNWHLFVILIDAVLSVLADEHDFSSWDLLDRIDSFRVADGCFRDGPNGNVDFYNAWGFHYSIFWLGEIRPDVLPAQWSGLLGEFVSWYQYLFTPTGTPLFGRSLCYRFATPGPLISAALRVPQVVDAATAASAFTANTRHFIREGGVSQGRFTQGVFGDDLCWLDGYSGPASAFWGTRSMVLFWYVGQFIDWERTPEHPLPSMTAHVERYVGGLDATLTTRPEAASSCVDFTAVQLPARQPAVRSRTWKDHARELVWALASRPSNNLLDAGVGRFCSSQNEYRSPPPTQSAS